MSFAQQSALAAETSAPPSISAPTLAVGDVFADAESLKIAFDRSLLAEGRQSRTDKRTSGGNGKLHRCTGAVIVDKVKGAKGCPVLIRACKQTKTKEWRVTELCLHHENCTGQVGGKNRRPSRKVVAAEYSALVNSCLLYTSPSPRDS